MSQHSFNISTVTLRSSVILMLVTLGTASVAQAQNYGTGYGWAQDPVTQPYRPYIAMGANPQQQWTPLANLQPAPSNVRQQGGYAQPMQTMPVQSAAVRSTNGYGNAIGYRDGQSAYGNGPSGYGCDSGCCDTCCQPCCPRWGLYVGGVWLTREDENHHNFSFDSSDESYQLLDSQESNFDDGFGPEVRLSWFNPCCCTGWEAVYWGLYPEESFAYANAGQVAGNLDPILDFTQLDDFNGVNASTFVNAAQVHRLRRENEIHNIEFNRLWQLSDCRDCSPWSFQALAGIRFFRFVDNLQFAADVSDATIDGDADEFYYEIDVDNDLYGFQVGGLAERQCCRHSRWSLTFGAKVGAFVNDARAHSIIYSSAGVATPNNGPNAGTPWDITSDKADLAMMAELQTGIAYRLACRWRVRAEYRLVGITGMALPTNQIYPDPRGLQDVQFLSNNGDVILHGGFMGVEWGY